MTDEQRKQLYDVLDFDEKTALAESLQAPRDSLKACVAAKLNKGSFSLKADPHGTAQDVISVVFDDFQANFIQRPGSIEASVSLGGFGIFDGTTKNTLYPQIVQVKKPGLDLNDSKTQIADVKSEGQDDPFLFVKFESNPLDERADNALTVRMRHMEIIYHKSYVEAVYKFFKPPASQLESVEALLVRVVQLSVNGI
jgi:Vacuolar protein sorting-associated protein